MSKLGLQGVVYFSPPDWPDRPGMATNFSTYASRMLGSFVPQDPFDDPVPLFYSTTSFQVGISHADDILGSSGESTSHQQFNHGARSYRSPDEDPLGNEEDDEEENRKPAPSRLASFPSRLYERSTANLSRGWKAYESKSALPDMGGYVYDRQVAEEVEEDLEEEDEDEEGSPPSFLSPLDRPALTTVEPLLPPSTLYIYPASPRAIGIASGSHYRDSPWLLPFFGALIVSVIVGVREWWIVKQVRRFPLKWCMFLLTGQLDHDQATHTSYRPYCLPALSAFSSRWYILYRLPVSGEIRRSECRLRCYDWNSRNNGVCWPCRFGWISRGRWRRERFRLEVRGSMLCGPMFHRGVLLSTVWSTES